MQNLVEQQKDRTNKEMKFRDYITSLTSTLQKSNPKRFVIGNSSADFDSIFGSIIYAYFLTSQLGQTYLPLIDCNKTDIPLRFDVNYIMKRLDIDYHKLLYTSDINYLDNQNSFCLYDHNHRSEIRVEQIVDHHAFHETESSPTADNRIIYPTGSTLTILYYLLNPKLLQLQQTHFKSAFDPYLKHHVNKQIENDSVVDEIIRHGVIVDCFGFDQKQAERWIPADKFLVQNIQKNHKFDLTYDDLSDLKFNNEMNLALTLQEHLRRDYKLFEYKSIGNVQYSIFCLDPDLFLKHYGEQIIQKFNIALYDTYIFMFIWVKAPKTNEKPAEYGREAIFSISPQTSSDRKEQILSEIIKVFKSLNLVEGQPFQNWYRWSDPSATVSRKKVDKYFRMSPSAGQL